MHRAIKVMSGEIVFSDGGAKPFSSLEQMLEVVSEEYKERGLADRVRVQGVDEEGKFYRLGLDFSSLQLKDGDTEETATFEKMKQQKFLGQLLVEAGVITDDQLQKALDEQGKLGLKEKLGEVLIRLGFCAPGQVIEGLSRQIGISMKPGEPKG